jgi:hypothetical protein
MTRPQACPSSPYSSKIVANSSIELLGVNSAALITPLLHPHVSGRPVGAEAPAGLVDLVRETGVEKSPGDLVTPCA